MEKKKALVIDDEQIVLDSVRKILTDNNYEVDVSLSGRKGLDWAIHRQYDILLTDIRMPDIGGMRVLRDNVCFNLDDLGCGIRDGRITHIAYHI